MADDNLSTPIIYKQPPTIDLRGQRYGRLLVVCYGGRQNYRSMWLCRCDCGVVKFYAAGDLRSGNSRSCGCYNKDVATQRNTRHGQSQRRRSSASPAYNSWASMMARCYNPNHTSYPSYGARGVKVCERWHSFENFFDDMGERQPGTSLDRWPDQKGNYEPGNCRWATPKQQARNRRSNRIITIGTRSMTLAEAAELYHIPSDKIKTRLNLGWAAADAVELAKCEERVAGDAR